MMKLKRMAGWRTRLADFIAEIRLRDFEWDKHDCGPAFAGRHVAVMTGVDLAADYRPYTTAEGALRSMKEAGFDDLADLVASLLPEILGEDGKPWVAKAQIGDIAAFKMDSPFGHSLGIVNGERVFVLREDGIGTMDLLQADRAFKVG